jgi:hypothetical protein
VVVSGCWNPQRPAGGACKRGILYWSLVILQRRAVDHGSVSGAVVDLDVRTVAGSIATYGRRGSHRLAAPRRRPAPAAPSYVRPGDECRGASPGGMGNSRLARDSTIRFRHRLCLLAARGSQSSLRSTHGRNAGGRRYLSRSRPRAAGRSRKSSLTWPGKTIRRGIKGRASYPTCSNGGIPRLGRPEGICYRTTLNS